VSNVTKDRLMDYHVVLIGVIKTKKNCQVCHRIFLSMALLGDFKVEMDGIYNSVIAMKYFLWGLS
jgi:hypothetical protein